MYLKPKYGIRVAGELFPPPLDEVIPREEKLVEFIIDKHPDDFSFELFKKEYDYYSRDLLDEMEPGFQLYLHTFFQDDGMPYLADSLNVGLPPCHLGDVVLDFKISLKPDLYKRLVDHSFDYAPPYLPLFQFCDKPQRKPPLGGKNYPDQGCPKIIDFINRYLDAMRKHIFSKANLFEKKLPF